MAGKGGGAWKVAYADFVTAMMAFFMVMWLTAQSDDVKKSVAEHFRNPGGRRLSGNDARSIVPSSNNGNGQKRVTRVRGPKKSDGEEKYRKMADEGNKANTGTVVEFDLNSTVLSEEGKERLLGLLPDLEGKTHLLELRGHAANSGGSNRQSFLDSWSISYQRSLAVSSFLVEQGIDPRRIILSQAGSSQPRITAEKLDTLNNSRVEIFVLADTFEDPSSTIERMVKATTLDEEARVLAEQDAAAAPPEGAKPAH